ncbi:Hypothetical predicted protein, partial [Paramuricea clavata]
PKGIRLRIKITHALRLEPKPREDDEEQQGPDEEHQGGDEEHQGGDEEQLRQNARAGIQELIKSGITVSGMEEHDWIYLFSMVQDAK